MRTAIRTPQTRVSIIHKDLSYLLGGLFYKTHDSLGRYARENQYGDFLENLFNEQGILYEREKFISKTGVDINRVDFIIENKILLELKVKPVITREDYYQVQRYLEIVNLQLGIIVNFRQFYLKPKRIINKNFKS